jgi:hypothetical protein
MKQVKELLFTLTGLGVSLLHLCFFIGVITLWIGIKLYVFDEVPLGNFSPPPPQQQQRSK